MPYFQGNKTSQAMPARYRPYGYSLMQPFRPFIGVKRAIQQTNRFGQSYTLTENKRRRKYNKFSFKNQLYDTMSAKHATNEQGLSMTHNTLYTLVPTAIPTQGDSNSNRNGDSIVLCGLKLNGFWNTDTASNGYSYRIIVGYTGEEYSNTTFGSGLGISELFLPSTGTNTSTLGQINAKAFTVIHDEKFTLNSQISGVRDKLDFTVYVPLNNKLFYYQSAASALGKDKNLVCIITGDVVAGTTGTTAIGGTTITWDFIFKNSN